jgi:putative RecB family exonuclease
MTAKISLANVLPEKPVGYPGFWASVSKIKTFKTCPAKFKFNYLDKLPKKTWEFHTLGKFAHFSLEQFHIKRLAGDIRPDNVLMAECFRLGVEEYKENLTKEQKDEVYQMMLKYLEKLSGARKATGLPEVLAVEEEFYIDIDGRVMLMGFIDRVQIDPDGILHVADYKTSKSKRYLVDDDFQLRTYAYVKCLQDPSIQKIRCSYIMLKHDFDYITFEFSREQVMKIEEKFLKDAEVIQAEALYRPEPSPLCDYCDFLEHCADGKDFSDERKRKQEEKNRKGARAWGQQKW